MTKDELRRFMSRQQCYRDKQAQLYYGGYGNTTLHKSQVRRATRLLIIAAMADCLLTQAEAAQRLVDIDYDEEQAKTLLWNIATMGKAFANLTDKEVYPID